jgi:rRNA maturation protein Nop10
LQNYVVLDGKEGKKYERIFPSIFTFSPDSKHLVYRAGEDCELGGYYNETNMCSRYFVVLDGKEGNKYDYIENYSLIFSPDSKHFAYIGGENCKQFHEYIKCSKYFIVLNGKEGKKYDYIYPPTFSLDNKYFIYFAKLNNEIWQIVEKL